MPRSGSEGSLIVMSLPPKFNGPQDSLTATYWRRGLPGKGYATDARIRGLARRQWQRTCQSEIKRGDARCPLHVRPADGDGYRSSRQANGTQEDANATNLNIQALRADIDALHGTGG